MIYCENCGTVLVDGAKFCQKCGAKVGTAAPDRSTRQQEYVGKLYKCPRCGEVLEPFVSNCPACGLELRGTKATSSVRELALKLEAIESKREPERHRGLFAQANARQHLSRTDEQKISLIRSFAVPNTKEDILEFMILATTNADATMYVELQPTMSRKAMAKAWISKVEQIYEKAKESYCSDPDFSTIQDLYDKCKANVKKHNIKQVLLWVSPIILFAISMASLSIMNRRDEKDQTAYFTAIVEEIQEQLENGDYKYALMNTDYLVWPYESEEENYRYWKLQREYWIDKIIEKAASDGVILERPEDPTEATPLPTHRNYTDIGIVDGVINGVSGNYD